MVNAQTILPKFLTFAMEIHTIWTYLGIKLIYGAHSSGGKNIFIN